MAQYNYQKKAQMAHLVNLISMAGLDGNIDEREQELLFGYADKLGLTKDEFDSCVETYSSNGGQGVAVIPETEEERAVYLKNLTTMMMIDGKVDDNEMEFIKLMAEKFGYNGEKALEILMNKVYQDFIKVAKEEEAASQASSEGGMDDEQFWREIKDLTLHGKKALEEYKISEAFDYLFFPAHVDETARRLFLMIVNNYTRLFMLDKKQVAQLKDYAEQGYAVSQYAYARYLWARRPEADSLDLAKAYFKKAEKEGMGDALYCQALMLKSGHCGLVDREMVDTMIDKAMDEGSTMAVGYVTEGMIYGRNDKEADPQLAVNILKEWLNGNESDDILVVDPMFYALLGNAYWKTGDYENGQSYLLKAINMGYIEAYGDYFFLNMELHDDDDTAEILERGYDLGNVDCYLYNATIDMNLYEKYPDSTGDIMHNLITAVEMGSSMAARFMGEAYYEGKYGFKKDNKQAWFYFTEGANRDDGESYYMLAVMIAEGDNPVEVSEDFAKHCVMMALRHGYDDILEFVVDSYHAGKLDEYAPEIEKYYLPNTSTN